MLWCWASCMSDLSPKPAGLWCCPHRDSPRFCPRTVAVLWLGATDCKQSPRAAWHLFGPPSSPTLAPRKAGQREAQGWEAVRCTSGGAHGRVPGLPCLGPVSQLHSGPLPLSAGVSVSPHPRSLLVSSVSLDKTPAGSPVPAGSGAFTGELGRQAGSRVRVGERKREKPKREAETPREKEADTDL